MTMTDDRPDAPAPSAASSRPNGIAARVAAVVQPLFGGRLPVRLKAWDGTVAGPTDAPTVVLRDPAALRRLVRHPGELGLAQAYVTGELDVEGDLLDGFRRVWRSVRDQHASPGLALSTVLAGLRTARSLGALGRPPAPPASQARLRGRLHTLTRDRAAIAHHYDLSNDFYALLLDDTMAYSCAYFTDPAMPLADAQRAKLDLICHKLGLTPGMHMLDVGCGWGSLIVHAAEHYGVRATGITLSGQQRDHIAKRVADGGLDHLVQVRLQDYRDLDVPGEGFDAVSSVEMGEHVGEGRYPGFARILHAALKPTGRLLLQQMSRHSETSPGGGPFIEAYIAPDMHMRPISRTIDQLEAAGLEIRDVEAMREHYVRTVSHWSATLESRWDEFVSLVGEETARVWRLYLIGGAVSFAEGRMGVDQVLAVRPGPDGTSDMPRTRPWAVG
jgi:cyclopropane-fatty-acyl-phospholipid synthase